MGISFLFIPIPNSNYLREKIIITLYPKFRANITTIVSSKKRVENA